LAEFEHLSGVVEGLTKVTFKKWTAIWSSDDVCCQLIVIPLKQIKNGGDRVAPYGLCNRILKNQIFET